MDIRDIADLLRRQPSFSEALAESLAEISWRLGTSRYTDEFYDEAHGFDEDRSGLVELVYEIVKRKRLAKREMLSSMRNSFPGYGDSSTKLLPAREIVADFVNSAPEEAVQCFLSNLGLEFTQDAYLSGIDRKRARDK